MTTIPHDPLPDSTLALLREGYLFIPRRCEALGTDIFEARLMLRRAFCVRGPEAAAMFYHPGRMTRRGAMPPTTVRLLQDLGSVQMLDGEAHRQRKAMFLRMMAPDLLRRLLAIAEEAWRRRFAAWGRRDRVVLFDEAQETMGEVALAWAGLSLDAQGRRRRTQEAAAMIDAAGSASPRVVRALLLRERSERWAREMIERVRRGELAPPPGSATQVIASHREPDGALLSPHVAAVELLNIGRPLVAVARFITFAALALHTSPASRELVASGTDETRAWFVHEVRRHYPFFPFIGGRAREPFAWRGHAFPRGAWFVLDIYGTNHDERSWTDPWTFQPERFRAWNGDPNTLIPQGGGRIEDGHRCAGEWATIALMTQAARLLATEIAYDVPPQDLEIPLRTMPTLPRSGLVISNVRPATGRARGAA